MIIEIRNGNNCQVYDNVDEVAIDNDIKMTVGEFVTTMLVGTFVILLAKLFIFFLFGYGVYRFIKLLIV